MICPECNGEGSKYLVPRKLRNDDWVYEDQRCVKCKGRGYLTPEEQGLEKF